ncbi:flagellar filament capping protein FliD [Butyrivibrio sp. WCD2001]|uniref:flagellar filament capping protein FliD n=1 Tax=Butyrivibrio sp. WCD2001 TaxID=1280681 RepID=UPI000407C9DC|nr:flagellar filament capping protein FliD [Butyrivibrio sp. WCD2001]
MGINVNMDYSTLFSSMSGSSSSTNFMSGLSSMLSDYSSIQNGSYGKLVSAYYKKIDSEKADSADKTEKESTRQTTETEKSKAAEKKQYSAISSNAKDVASKLDTLSKTGDNSVFEKTWQTVKDEDGTESKVYDYDMSKISSAVSNFISSYNKLIDSTGDISDVTTDTRASYLGKITNSYKSELSSIGISIKDDGKLSLDKDKLKAAGAEATQNIFTQKAGFGYKVSQAATSLETSASRAASSSSTYSKTGTMNSDLSSILDSFI